MQCRAELPLRKGVRAWEGLGLQPGLAGWRPAPTPRDWAQGLSSTPAQLPRLKFSDCLAPGGRWDSGRQCLGSRGRTLREAGGVDGARGRLLEASPGMERSGGLPLGWLFPGRGLREGRVFLPPATAPYPSTPYPLILLSQGGQFQERPHPPSFQGPCHTVPCKTPQP